MPLLDTLAASLYDSLLRPSLYAVSGGDAETVHQRTLAALALADRRPEMLAPLAALTRTDDPEIGRAHV